MRSLICKAGLITSAFVLLGACPARASTINVKVPFSFVVSGRTLPAGEYQVTSDGRLVQLRDEKDPSTNLIFMSMPASGHDPAGNKPALTFTLRDNQSFLNDIWESGTSGVELTVHKARPTAGKGVR